MDSLRRIHRSGIGSKAHANVQLSIPSIDQTLYLLLIHFISVIKLYIEVIRSNSIRVWSIEKCGHFASVHIQKHSEECIPPNDYGRRNLERIWNDKLPYGMDLWPSQQLGFPLSKYLQALKWTQDDRNPDFQDSPENRYFSKQMVPVTFFSNKYDI